MASAANPDPTALRLLRSSFLASLQRPVSPPPRAQSQQCSTLPEVIDLVSDDEGVAPKTKKQRLEPPAATSTKPLPNSVPARSAQKDGMRRIIPSPFQLTRIADLPDGDNIAAVTLHDLLGNPLISEAWIFNYCFDVDFTMQHFDTDIRDAVSVKIIHGSWRKEDRNKQYIDDACRRWANVDAIQAYLPDAYGTHHTKMIVLFSHDDKAEIIIHTANMQAGDWKHATQAVWRSPPLQQGTPSVSGGPPSLRLGSGTRFKHDFLRYLGAYGKKLANLTQEISKYDFSQIRGALIGSVPSKIKDVCRANARDTWGHPALRHALKEMRCQTQTTDSQRPPAHIVSQCSSVSTLKAGWLENVLFRAMDDNLASSFSIVYPTGPDVRNSLDGYGCGSSIHMKISSPAHQKQVAAIRPYLCRWTKGILPTTQSSRRDLCAPHIKTYISFKSKPTASTPAPAINWALLTSANLSIQAWGTDAKMPTTKGTKLTFDATEAEVHIQSYELGVLVWPELWAEADAGSRNGDCVMVPTFGRNLPQGSTLGGPSTIIGLRMPYDLPLTPYTAADIPWSPNVPHLEPDRYGMTWPPDESWG